MMNGQQKSLGKTGLFIVLFSLLVAAMLTVAVWDINFWPTDAEDYYLPAAAKLSQLKYVSQMHEHFDQTHVKWLHGKEMFIVSASWLQRLTGDTRTLRPLILVCILSVSFSAILIFYIARGYWGQPAGLLCYAVFTTSFWPYLYILFVKHQPLGLFYFLWALFFVQRAKGKKTKALLHLSSGACSGLSLYSSTTAILYMPYLFVGFLYSLSLNFSNREKIAESFRNLFSCGLLFLFGFAVVCVYFNYPQIIGNIKSYLEYVEISKRFSHFFYNQPVLIQWMAHPEAGVRGGWLWVVKYFELVMPVLFPFYVLCVGYLWIRALSLNRKMAKIALTTLGMIVLSFSTPLFTELKGVAQYGANYFTVLVGMIMLLGYSFDLFLQGEWWKKATIFRRQATVLGLTVVGGLHGMLNFYIFATDIYPTRMATTFLSRKIAGLNIKELHTYMHHPYRVNMVDSLDPRLVSQLKFRNIQHLLQPLSGYILVPPVCGNGIYKAVHSAYNDFDKDIYLNELLRKGNIQDYAVVSFKTMAASRIWPHEEEILSYRYLILNQVAFDDPARAKVWLLDAQKLQGDAAKNLPNPEYVELVQKGIRNIGSREPIYRYEGRYLSVEKKAVLKSIPAKVYKVGHPSDKLLAYVYKVDQEQSVWVPLSGSFMSLAVEGRLLTSNPAGELVQFNFSEPLLLEPGNYRLVIYRTGQPQDRDYYRIYERLY